MLSYYYEFSGPVIFLLLATGPLDSSLGFTAMLPSTEARSTIFTFKHSEANLRSATQPARCYGPRSFLQASMTCDDDIPFTSVMRINLDKAGKAATTVTMLDPPRWLWMPICQRTSMPACALALWQVGLRTGLPARGSQSGLCPV